MSPAPDPERTLAQLCDAVAQAVVAQRKDRGSLIDMYLSPTGWAMLGQIVEALQSEGRAHAHVSSEPELGSVVLAVLAEQLASGEALRGLESLAVLLERRLEREPERWVAAPLGNVRVPDHVTVLARGSGGEVHAALVPTLGNLRDSTQIRRASRLQRELTRAGVSGMPVTTRFGPGPVEAENAPGYASANPANADSRVGALLLLREQGTPRLARHRALVHARYAIATWCLFDPPDRREPFSLWPALAVWQSPPYQHVEPAARAVEPQPIEPEGARGGEFEYLEYELDTDEARLSLPWRAFAASGSRRPARALLSAAWSLYAALYPPSELLVPDRIVHVLAAREAMCAAPAGVHGKSERRWDAVARHLRVYRRLADQGEGSGDPALVERRVSVLRNLTVHAGDAFALAVGGPIDATRHEDVSRAQLVHAIAWSDAGLAATAIGMVGAELLLAADSTGYDESAYERHFSGGGSSIRLTPRSI